MDKDMMKWNFTRYSACLVVLVDKKTGVESIKPHKQNGGQFVILGLMVPEI